MGSAQPSSVSDKRHICFGILTAFFKNSLEWPSLFLFKNHAKKMESETN